MRRSLRPVGAIALLIVLAGTLIATLTLGGGSAGPAAAASEATPAGTPAGQSTEARLYQDFVGKLAANLGITDPSRVDAALKTTVGQLIDEQQAAGNLTQKQATALKRRIEQGQFPPNLMTLLQSHHKHQGKHGKHATPPAETLPATGTPTV